ncbi:MAG: RING finger protein [Aigarchaeota archaeon]|nr:RING finger protein [Aigarchaeota archaeon]
MYLGVQEAERRLFRMALIAGVVGFINIASLFLSWYVHTAENLQSEPIMGYMRVETLALSLAGGVVASASALSSWIAKRLKRIKRAESSLALVGGIISILSPIVMMTRIVPGLEEAGGGGYFDVGLFVSAISAAAVVLVGVFISLIPVSVEEVPSVAAPSTSRWTTPMMTLPPPLLTEAPPVERRPEVRTVVMESADELVEGAMCTICYQPMELGSTVKCSACGALYHQGCVDVWVDLNGICPNCKNPVEATYPRED